MKKLKLFVMSLCAMFVAVLGVNAANAIPDAVGNKVTLDDDVELSTRYVVPSNVTEFDLGGHTITLSNNAYVLFNTTNDVVITNGTINQTGEFAAVIAINSGKVTMRNLNVSNKDTLTNSIAAVQVGAETSDSYAKGVLSVEDGTVITGARGIGVFGPGSNVEIKGGRIETSSFAISGNGNATQCSNSIINISGGIVKSTAQTAIYHPQTGTLTITGGEIEGVIGIVARQGKIDIKGGKITATGTGEDIRVGDADAKKPGQVCSPVSDEGCIKLPQGVAVIVDNSVEGAYTDVAEANIETGEFNVPDGKSVVLDYNNEEEKNIKVSGGKFSETIPEDYLASTDLGQSESGVVGKVSTITVDKAENVNVEVPTNAAEGEEVTINVTPDEGYVIKEVLVNGTAVTKNADGTYSFVMPDKEVTITVNTEVETKEVVVEEQAAGDKEVTLSKETDEVLKDSLANTKDEELQELLKNNDVTVELKATKIEKESLEKEEVAKFENVVKGANVTEFFDLSILVEAAGEEVHYLKELSKPITLTIDLPELPEVAKGYERKYYIIREHNGVYEKLNATLKDGKLSFATDKFSTYALAYIDEKVKNPNTVDNIASVVATGLVSLAVIAGGIVLVRKNKFNN